MNGIGAGPGTADPMHLALPLVTDPTLARPSDVPIPGGTALSRVSVPMVERVRTQHGFAVVTDHLVLFGFCERCRETGWC